MTDGWMDPIPHEQGGWPYNDEPGAAKPELTSLVEVEPVEATPLNDDTPPPEPEPVELDSEAAEARLSAAAQEVVVLATTLIHNSKSDVFIRKEDMKSLRAAVNEFELAYAETVTVGKLIALAESIEARPALGDNVPADIGMIKDPESRAEYIANLPDLDAPGSTALMVGSNPNDYVDPEILDAVYDGDPGVDPNVQ